MTNPYKLSSLRWGQYIQLVAYSIGLVVAFTYTAGVITGARLRGLCASVTRLSVLLGMTPAINKLEAV